MFTTILLSAPRIFHCFMERKMDENIKNNTLYATHPPYLTTKQCFTKVRDRFDFGNGMFVYLGVICNPKTSDNTKHQRTDEKNEKCQRFAKLKEVFATSQADTKHHI